MLYPSGFLYFPEVILKYSQEAEISKSPIIYLPQGPSVSFQNTSPRRRYSGSVFTVRAQTASADSPQYKGTTARYRRSLESLDSFVYHAERVQTPCRETSSQLLESSLSFLQSLPKACDHTIRELN